MVPYCFNLYTFGIPALGVMVCDKHRTPAVDAWADEAVTILSSKHYPWRRAARLRALIARVKTEFPAIH